jgi:ribosome-associated heat shock protein Hsp15
LNGAPEGQRIDKWLWAARFFKTRNLATTAVDGGKVRLGGIHVKPARDVKPGDELEISIGDQRFTVVVHGLSQQRRPAPEARLLYEETAASRAARAALAERKRLAPVPGADLRGRPTKRAGRMLRRFSAG